MKRLAILIPAGFSVTILLAACSGYFTNEGVSADKGKITKLEISGGGNLSTDEHNEITPFLFRDFVTGNAWLFYASDETGNYNIYYAKLNDDGSFESPQALGASINTSYDEYSPVVCRALGMNSASSNIYITYIQKTGTATNVYLAQLDNSMGVAGAASSQSFASVASITGLGLSGKRGVTPELLVSTNGYDVTKCGWIAGSTFVSWQKESSYDFNGTAKKRAADSWLYASGGGYAAVYFYDNNTSGKYQLYGAYEGSATNEILLDEYSSEYNDRNPCVDSQTKQVYFASDRLGNNNYDLYRYNVTKANVAVAEHVLNLVNIPPIDEGSFVIYNNGSGYITYNTMNTNKIDGYILYRKNITDGETSFKEVKRIPVSFNGGTSNFFDDSAIDGNTYEYYARPYYQDALGVATSTTTIVKEPS